MEADSLTMHDRTDAPSTQVPDEVDRILHGWATARPEIDAAPLAVFSRITRIARMLDLARRRAFAAHNIEVWEFDVLSALRRGDTDGDGLTPGALMAENMVASGTMTNRLQRMETHGLISRVPDEKDRRVVRVRLTEYGMTQVDAALEALLRDERALLATVGESERETLAALLRQLMRPLEDEHPSR